MIISIIEFVEKDFEKYLVQNNWSPIRNEKSEIKQHSVVG